MAESDERHRLNTQTHTLNSRVGASDTTRTAVAGWVKVPSKNAARMRTRALRLQHRHHHRGVNNQSVRFLLSLAGRLCPQHNNKISIARLTHLFNV